MKKATVLSFLWLYCLSSIAQNTTDSTLLPGSNVQRDSAIVQNSTAWMDFTPGTTAKVTIHYKGDSVITGTITRIKDSTVDIIQAKKSKADTTLYYPCEINIADIQSIKVKRDAFLLGAVTGGGIGYLAGYAGGYISYNNNNDISQDQNTEDQKTQANVVGLVAAIPTGILGGLVSGVVLRRTFIINGSREKMHQLTKVL